MEALVGDISESGHVDEDGTWHAEPHTPEDVSEVTTEVQGARAIAQEATAPIAAPIPDLSKSARDTEEAWKTYNAWYKKTKELDDQHTQLGQELLDLMPETIEEWERFETDENFRSEVQSRARELFPKIFEMHRKENEQLEKEPVLP